jgi:hypothetical protein
MRLTVRRTKALLDISLHTSLRKEYLKSPDGTVGSNFSGAMAPQPISNGQQPGILQ